MFFIILLCSLRHSSSYYRRPTALIQRNRHRLNLLNPVFFHVVQLSYIKTMLQLHLYSIMQGKYMYIQGALGTTYSSEIFHGPASLRSSGCQIREVQPVLPSYQLVGSSLSRKDGLATFVHERLRYMFLDQSSPTSKMEWLCNVHGC